MEKAAHHAAAHPSEADHPQLHAVETGNRTMTPASRLMRHPSCASDASTADRLNGTPDDRIATKYKRIIVETVPRIA